MTCLGKHKAEHTDSAGCQPVGYCFYASIQSQQIAVCRRVVPSTSGLRAVVHHPCGTASLSDSIQGRNVRH